MYKIKCLSTGNVFELPNKDAQELKDKFPDDYKILEKDGKKFKDCIKKKPVSDGASIRSKVVEE